MSSPPVSRHHFAFIALLVLSGCEPLRSEVFHPPSSETPDTVGEQPDAGGEQPDAGGEQPDAGTSPFCFEDDQWGWDVRFAFDGRRVGHFAYIESELPYIVTTNPGAIPQSIANLHTSRITDLEIDAQGYRHILFPAEEQGYSVYASDRQSSWQTTVLDAGQPIELAIDPGGAVHVLGENSGVLYGTNRSGQWLFEKLYLQAFPNNLVLAVDASGYAHVAYGHDLGDGIFYATNASGAWRTEQVDPRGSGKPALTIDAAGRPHVFYWNLKDFYFHAIKVAETWRHTPVARGAGAASALQVDSFGTTHVVFDSSSTSLSYANSLGGLWSVLPLFSLKTANPTDTLSWASFTLEDGGQPIVGYGAGSLGDGQHSTQFRFAQPRPCP